MGTTRLSRIICLIILSFSLVFLSLSLWTIGCGPTIQIPIRFKVFLCSPKQVAEILPQADTGTACEHPSSVIQEAVKSLQTRTDCVPHIPRQFASRNPPFRYTTFLCRNPTACDFVRILGQSNQFQVSNFHPWLFYPSCFFPFSRPQCVTWVKSVIS